MYYLAFDIETTGRSCTQHRMIAIGACLVDTDTVKVVEPRDEHTFRALLPVPDVGSSHWEQRCYDEFWNDVREECGNRTPLALLAALAEQHGTMQVREAMAAFWQWATRMCAKFPDQVQLVTDTVGYDAGWLNYYLAAHLDTENRHHALEYVTGEYRALRCTTSHYIGGAGRPLHARSSGAKRQLLQRIGGDDFPRRINDSLHNHDPASDAESIALEAAWVTREIERTAAQHETDC